MVSRLLSTHPCSISFMKSVILSMMPPIYLMRTGWKAVVSASKLNLSITAGLQQIKIFILKNITM